MRRATKIRMLQRAVIQPLLFLHLVALSIAYSAPAVACSVFPGPEGPTQIIRGDDCSVEFHHRDSSDDEGVSAPVDMGGGYIYQTFFVSRYCSGSTMSLVTDCSSGKTLAVGYSDWDINREPYDGPESTEVDRLFATMVKARIEEGSADLLGDLQAEAAKSFDESVVLSMRNGLRLSIGSAKPRHTYYLGCGCKRFYPESSVASD